MVYNDFSCIEVLNIVQINTLIVINFSGFRNYIPAKLGLNRAIFNNIAFKIDIFFMNNIFECDARGCPAAIVYTCITIKISANTNIRSSSSKPRYRVGGSPLYGYSDLNQKICQIFFFLYILAYFMIFQNTLS
jgi:hypothetical protein